MTDAVIPAEDLMGGLGNGWAIATTTLSIERQGFARGRNATTARHHKGRIYEELASELETANEPYVWYPQREGRVDLIVKQARQTGAINDPVIRQEIARLLCLADGARLTAASAARTRKAGSNEIIPAGSIGKLGASVVARKAAEVHTMIQGAAAMLSGPDSAEDGMIAETLISVPAISIAGGTDEIQRNIIAERVLGMPKEQRMDTGPFRDIKRNTT